MTPDVMLSRFLETQPEGRGVDWQQRVMDALQDKPIELIKRWVDKGLPRGFFRAEIRGYLKQRLSEEGGLLEHNPQQYRTTTEEDHE